MTLRIETNKDETGIPVIALIGELNSDTAAQCEQALKTALTMETKDLSLELHRLKYISSIGLRLILKLQKDISKRGGRLRLKNMTAPVAKVFEIADMLPPDVSASELSEDIFLDAIQRRESVKKHDISN